MLNLDSEEEGGICIGCAGGVDIFARNSNKKIILNDENPFNKTSRRTLRC